ncbi:unnamed protein product, partial [Tilletia laevis]
MKTRCGIWLGKRLDHGDHSETKGFLLSPRQAHSLAELKHALGLAEALGAPNVPSINVCKKALARIYLRGKEKLVRSTDVDGNVFWRNSVASLLKEDFCNSA